MRKLIILTTTILVVLIGVFLVNAQEKHFGIIEEMDGNADIAEGMIETFIMDKHLMVERTTDAYMEFLKGVLRGDYPELTGEESEYIYGQEDLDLLLEYATRQTSPIYKDYPPETEVKEILPIVEEDETVTESRAYSRTNAVTYATDFCGGRNGNYPDFSSDCTNFVSQIVRAGGISMFGSTDGCRDESTQTEWYVVRHQSPPLWCIGSYRNWMWSTAWSVVYDFRRCLTYYNNYATELGWTTSHSTAKSLLSPGDVIQIQQKSGSQWVSTHTVFVRVENSTDLKLASHTSDYCSKKLRDIPTGTTQRYVLIRFN